MKGCENMNCPVCGEKSTVTDTAIDIDATYRRRKCKSCNYVFFTEEVDVANADIPKVRSRILELREAKRKGDKNEG